MTKRKFRAIVLAVTTSLAIALLPCGAATAETVNAEGLITARSGATMTLQTSDSQNLTVLLTDSTQVAQLKGLFKARNKEMSMAALIPGLKVRVQGSYNNEKQLVATSVKFKGNDLEDAQTVQAGLEPTKQQVEQSQQELAQQKAALQQQQEALQKQQQHMSEAQAKIDANKASIEAAQKRFGQLAEYNILDELTVYFDNGKATFDPKYNPQLLQLTEQAKTITAYIIQVKGYASAAGSTALNQKLSEQRANNVAQFLQQQGHVPLTNMLAPGAMGESRQVASDNAGDNEASNRRVVVRILQNKGIAGT